MSRAVLVDAPGSYRIVPAEATEPGPGEAVVRVAAAGMCGSDRELFAGTRPAPFVRYPVVPGHEWSGVVDAVGPGVAADLVGAEVVGEGFRACFTCARCRTGDTNLCEAGYDETGFTQSGAFADCLVLPARLLHVLAPGRDVRAAALLEPAACAMDAVDRTFVQPGERVAVVGAGTLGLLAVALLAARSPAQLVAVDTRPAREDLALRLGATSFCPPGDLAASAASAASADQRDFDVVVEAAGAAGSAQVAAQACRRGGRLALLGIPGDPSAAIPLGLLVGRQLTVVTVFGASASGWLGAVCAFNTGLLDPAPLITHELSLEDYGKAIELLSGPRFDVGKILLLP
jgi:2-desacetyl-2-hydroxyethyl bacteriochlorophyllide A dehydrogenase